MGLKAETVIQPGCNSLLSDRHQMMGGPVATTVNFEGSARDKIPDNASDILQRRIGISVRDQL